MKMNHLNLTVPNVSETLGFFEKYFGLHRMEGMKPNDAIALMQDDDGLVLTLMRARDGSEVRYPETFHIGFIQPTEEHVNRINQRLKEDGFEVAPPRKFHGSWTFYFQAPGGFTIEVMA